MCPLHIIREGIASKHAQSKLLNFYPLYLVFTWFLPKKHFGPLLRSYTEGVERLFQRAECNYEAMFLSK